MNTYVAGFLLLSVGVHAAILDYSFDQIWMGLASKFRSKCASIGGPHAYSKLQLAVLELDDCVPINFQQPDTICTTQRQKSFKCYEDFLGVLETCLEPQEKYIKNIFLVAHNNTFINNCQNNGQDLLKKKLKAQMAVCTKPGVEIAAEFIKECAPKLSIIQNLYKQDDVITENDFCNDVDIVTKCDIKAKQYCQNYQDVEEFFKIIFNSYQAACKKDNNNNTLIG